MSKITKLPKTVYIRLAGLDDDEPYISASETMKEAIEDDGPSTIGVYRWERTLIARKSVEFTEPRKKKARV